MMRATLTDDFRCSPEGHTIQTLAKGTVVSGKVAKWAMGAGKATELFDPRDEAKVIAPDEVKAPAKRRSRSRKKAV